MEVIWTERVRHRLREIYDHIAKDQPQNAMRWIVQLINRGDRIGDQPWAGRMVPEYQDETIREVFQGDYRIIYENQFLRLHPDRASHLTTLTASSHRRLSKF